MKLVLNNGEEFELIECYSPSFSYINMKRGSVLPEFFPYHEKVSMPDAEEIQDPQMPRKALYWIYTYRCINVNGRWYRLEININKLT